MDIGATGLGLIDYVIFIMALVAVLIVGLKSGGKIKNLEDYATSRRRKFSTPVLAMTLMATAIGSNTTVGAIAEIYNSGIIYMVSHLLTLVGTFLLIQYAAKFIAGRYEGVISLHGIIEREYGVWAARLSASFSVFITLISLAMQVIGMGYIAKAFLGIPFFWGAALSSGVFILYSSVGGIRSVVYTDVVQFFIILVVFPILTGVIIYKAGGVGPILAALPLEKLKVIDHPNIVEYSFLTLFWMMPFSLLYGIFIQRFLMCENAKELRQIGMSWVAFETILIIMITIIALSGLVLLQDINSGKEVVPALMRDYLPIGLRGLAITAFFAVIMSTADSYLNAATILISEIMMTKKEREKRDQRNKEVAMGIVVEEEGDDKRQVSRAILSGFFLGGGAFLLALLDFSFIKVITIGSAFVFSAVNIPIFFAPFKSQKIRCIKAYIGSVVGGSGSFMLFWIIFGQERAYMASFFAMIFSIAGWFIGANFFDRVKTNFWRKMIGYYSFDEDRKLKKIT
jgi:Na+/proline symporter